MQRILSVLCLFVALLVSSSEAFAQARSPVSAPPARRAKPTAKPEKYVGTIETGSIETDDITVEGVKITYNGTGSESATQAGMNHEKGVRLAHAERRALTKLLPTKTKIVEKEVVKNVPVPGPVVYVDRTVPVHVPGPTVYVGHPGYYYRSGCCGGYRGW